MVLLPLSAHARFTIVCQGFIDSPNTPFHETVEMPLNFEPFGAELRARVSFELRTFPEYIFEASVFESFDNGPVSWYTTMLAKRKSAPSDVVMRGHRIIEFEKNGSVANVVCGSFDKTDSLTLPPAPVDARDKGRRDYLRGLGPVREIGRPAKHGVENHGTSDGDAYDLFLQVLAQQDAHGAKVREAVARLERKGFKIKIFDSNRHAMRAEAGVEKSNSPCDRGGRRTQCDVESVELHAGYSGWETVRGRREAADYELIIKLELTRDSKTRLIYGFAVKGLKTEAAGGEGGTASTSGGR